MEIRPVEAEFHANRQTDMTTLIVAFLNFPNAPKNSCVGLVMYNITTDSRQDCLLDCVSPVMCWTSCLVL
jgi:hypothetical protein